MAMQKTIAVDIDDVLARYAEGFAAFSNERWGSGILAEHYSEDWASVWRVPQEEVQIRVKEFYGSDVYNKLEHVSDAVPVLTHLKMHYNLLIVTSRKSIVRKETDLWLGKHFAGLFTAVHYLGIWDTGHDIRHKLRHTKAGLCRELGVDFLIDDQPKHCIAAAEAGIEALLFGDYAWNRDVDVPHQNIFRAKSWEEVKGYFDAKG